MYELMILSLLMYAPLHGYLIAKIVNDMIGPFAKVSNGTLYPLLMKLEKAGLIAISESQEQQHGERHARTFEITELGRKRFHKLMMDTSSNPGEYQKFFSFKVPHIALLEPAERLHLLNHYITYCQTHVLYLRDESKELQEETSEYLSPVRLAATLDVMERSIEQWQLELDWVMRLREKEVARIEAAGQGIEAHEEESKNIGEKKI